MAGTDKTKSAAKLSAPSIILVQPKLPENVGMVARAMLNCGLTDLRVVSPRWLEKNEPLVHPKSVAASAGASSVIQEMKLFHSVEDAIGDIQYLVATTARHHDMFKRVLDPDSCAENLSRYLSHQQTCAVMFGCERAGLLSDHIALANDILTIPLNPAYSSLNLAQAVLIVSYCWTQQAQNFNLSSSPSFDPAKKEEIFHFLSRLEQELDNSGFLRVQEKRPTMVRNIRNIFTKLPLDSQEIRTLEGMLTFLTKTPEEKKLFTDLYEERRQNRKK